MCPALCQDVSEHSPPLSLETISRGPHITSVLFISLLFGGFLTRAEKYNWYPQLTFHRSRDFCPPWVPQGFPDIHTSFGAGKHEEKDTNKRHD